LGREAVGPIRAGVALVALRALRASATRGARIALVALRAISAGIALVALVSLVALSGLSRTSRLDTVQLGSSDRRTTLGPIGPLIRLKSHQASSPFGNRFTPGTVVAPGGVRFPQRPRPHG